MKMKKVFALILSLSLLAGLAGCGGTQESAAPAPAESTAESTAPSESTAPAPAQSSEAVPASSAEAPAEPVELTFYYPTQVGGDLAIGMEEMVEDFNASHPGIHVTPVYTGSYKNTAQTAMTDIAGGNAPNVILSGLLDIVDYYNIGKVKNLNELIAGEGDAWKNDFIDGFWGSLVYDDGGTYGLPYQHSICVLYYNKEKLGAAGVANPPETWEEYLTVVNALAAADNKTVTIEFPSDVWILEQVTLSDGDKLTASKTETRFDSPAAIESLDLLQQMIQKNGMVMSYADAAEDFIAESSAMMLNTTGNLGFVIKDATFDWGVALPPVKESPGLSYGGGALIMIDGQTPEEEAASWEFMKWMTEPEQSARWMTISGYFCVRKSCDDLDIVKEYYAANPQVGQAAGLLLYTTGQWTTDSYWDVYAYMQEALDSVLIDGSVKAADALPKAQEGAMSVLS